jgi:DNA-binding transcriptional LysR family regulator
MDLLAALRTFSRVAETGSFSAVAREAGTTQPAVSRQIAALEEHLGVRLLQRSTRSLALTEDGRDLLGHAARVLEAVEETEAVVGRRRTAPAGLVRIGCPTVFGRMYVAPRMGSLLERYPDLSVELRLSDARSDLIQEGLDVALRVGEPTDSTLIARRLGSTSRMIVASTDYLQRHGEPQTPAELAQHACLIFVTIASPEDWHFEGPDGPVSVRVSGRFRTDNGDAQRAAMLSGLGIAIMPGWLINDALRSGEVKSLLRAWQPARVPVNAVYPSRRYLAPRTRAVIDFLIDEFRLEPAISAYGET